VAEELSSLWLLRHGQSLGNVANDAARASDLERLDLSDRDMDVPLSDLGVQQAEAFGVWLAAQPRGEWPDAVVSSPYRRAVDTARHVVAAAGMDVEIVPDERLREREFGILDLLTHRGVVATYPDEALRRDRIGKFYYRPPGGESWVDVALRLRSLRDSLVREHADRRVLMVTHEVPILITRYLIERLDEAAALELSRAGQVGELLVDDVRPWRRRPSPARSRRVVAPLEESRAPITDEPDAAVASR
jgi:broad specificity phosphatase PhoE